MNIKKAVSFVLLSSLISSSFAFTTSKDVSAATTYSSSTTFSMKYDNSGLLDLYAGNDKINRIDGGIGRDFVYGRYGEFYYKCRSAKSGESEQALVDAEAVNLSDQMAQNCDKLGWLRTRITVQSPVDNAKCYGYAIDYYYNSIDLNQNKRTTAGDTLKKGFTIKNELQTSIPNLSDYHMPLVTKIKVYEQKKLKVTLAVGDTYKLSKKETVAQVIIDPDNYCYCIYLQSGTSKGSSATTKNTGTTNKTTNKNNKSTNDVQTDDVNMNPVYMICAVSGLLAVIIAVMMIKSRRKD